MGEEERFVCEVQQELIRLAPTSTFKFFSSCTYQDLVVCKLIFQPYPHFAMRGDRFFVFLERNEGFPVIFSVKNTTAANIANEIYKIM